MEFSRSNFNNEKKTPRERVIYLRDLKNLRRKRHCEDEEREGNVSELLQGWKIPLSRISNGYFGRNANGFYKEMVGV